MADKPLIAAILAAGMLPPLPLPPTTADGTIGAHDQAQLVNSVLHAVGLYRSILEGLATKPKASPEAVNSGVGANGHHQPEDAGPVVARMPSLIRSSSSAE